MAKTPVSLHVRIPPYRYPRNQWRRDIYASVVERLATERVHYRDTDRLELNVRLYFDRRSLRWHDVDNRLKDVLDTLQGRGGGSKAKPTWSPILPNDRQVFKVVVEKFLAPKQSKGAGHLFIRKYTGARAV
jgi:Holliday junction resolvase RusA-like endonuclease